MTLSLTRLPQRFLQARYREREFDKADFTRSPLGAQGLCCNIGLTLNLVYDSVHGLGWNDPKGWEVYFGSEDQDMEMKLTVYQALVDRLENEGIQPAMISVEYVHAPYYRMER